MKNLGLARYAFGVSTAVTILADCNSGASQSGFSPSAQRIAQPASATRPSDA